MRGREYPRGQRRTDPDELESGINQLIERPAANAEHAGDGRADLRDTRPFSGRPGPHGKGDMTLFEPCLTGLSNNDETIERSER